MNDVQPNSAQSHRGPPSLDLRTLGSRSDEELDTLPFGVIALNRAGIISKYNLAEARFARLDRADVLGKDFFTRVAPCTNTPGFRGRFDELAREGNTAPSVQFTYVFDFRFGAQEVEIEIVRSALPNQFFVTINRRKFLPVRREVPSSQVAPLQRELSPTEDRVGVQRDSGDRRIVQVPPIFFDALASAHDRMGPAAAEFLDTFGYAWGRRAAVDLETEVLESFDKLLRELPMVTVAEVITQHLRRQGWGQLTVDFAPAKRGVFLLHLERSAFAEASAPGSKHARCGVFTGFFRAVFSHLASRALVVRETECVALGASKCAFIVAGETRAPSIDAAVASARDGSPLSVTSAVLRGLGD